jgi:hypothetical protein
MSIPGTNTRFQALCLGLGWFYPSSSRRIVRFNLGWYK